METPFYHISSNGLEKELIFISEEDFITGVNDAAICSLRFKVKILCYCLMNNHFHFILSGELEECECFAAEYKRRCAIRMRQRHDKVKALKSLVINTACIDEAEYLVNSIAYVLRNPLAARMMQMPYHYPWSSAEAYFRGVKTPRGEEINKIPERKRYRILKSRIDIPDSFRVNEKGMILPECFVDYQSVESIFKHPTRLLFLLGKRIETDIELKLGIVNQINIPDNELQTRLLELMKEKYGVSSISMLTREQKIRLITDLKKNYGASDKQIARTLRIDLSIVEMFV